MEQQQRGVYVGLAVASAVVVLVSTAVAVTRLGSRHPDRHRQVAMASPTEPSHRAAPAAPLPHGTQSTLGVVASQVRPVSVPRQPHRRPGSIPAPGVAASTGLSAPAQRPQPPASTPALTAPTPGPVSGATPPAAEQPAPPAPAQPLVAASVSAGKGTTGGVVGVGLDHDPAVDVTVGTTPLVGHAPPSQGTEIALGGQLLHPPPTIPVLPGAIAT